MELEYKLAAIIGSCINEDQLTSARLCYLSAAATQKITQEQHVFLKKTADHKEQYLKDQMRQFELDKQGVELHTELSNQVDVFEVTPLPSEEVTAENVAKAAEGLSIKERLTRNVFIGFPGIGETPFSKRNFVQDIDAD
jgi:hypothetical protein